MAVRVEWSTAEQRSLTNEQALGLPERVGLRCGQGKALDVFDEREAQVDMTSGVL
jgi:hypothetical protein